MYPGISDLLNDLLGTNFGIHFPPTFGTLVAISFLFAAWTLRLELQRKEKDGLLKGQSITTIKGAPVSTSEILWNAFFGLLIGSKLGYAIFNKAEFFENPQAAILSLKGHYLSGFIIAGITGYLKYREGKQQELKEPKKEIVQQFPSELVTDFTMMAALGGLIGAKFFHLLEYWEDFIQDPIGGFFSGSGLTMYGGLIVGSITVLWYARKHAIALLPLCDAAAPGLMLAYGTGRLGCQLSGDGDWGIVNTTSKPDWLSWLPDWCWSFKYPNNVINEGVPIPGCEGKYCYELAAGVFPTPLYEAVTCILLFFVLWSIRKKIAGPGQIFAIYLLLNGIERFLVELIRVNSQYHIGGFGFTQAQLISSLLIIVGTSGYFYFRPKTVQV
jgi:phosphatidylglycerol:prolipoprotein diacylglycerol transferase